MACAHNYGIQAGVTSFLQKGAGIHRTSTMQLTHASYLLDERPEHSSAKEACTPRIWTHAFSDAAMFRRPPSTHRSAAPLPQMPLAESDLDRRNTTIRFPLSQKRHSVLLRIRPCGPPPHAKHRAGCPRVALMRSAAHVFLFWKSVL